MQVSVSRMDEPPNPASLAVCAATYAPSLVRQAAKSANGRPLHSKVLYASCVLVSGF